MTTPEPQPESPAEVGRRFARETGVEARAELDKTLRSIEALRRSAGMVTEPKKRPALRLVVKDDG